MRRHSRRSSGRHRESLGINIIIDARSIGNKAKQQNQRNGPQVENALPAEEADYDRTKS